MSRKNQNNKASGPISSGESRADRAIRFINGLTHTKGKWAAQGFDLRDWQKERIIRPLFGTIRPDGLRQYRTCFTMLPRKNGKSEIAATIALYMLLADGEQGAEVYSAAADRDQAALVFNVAAQMIRNDPELSGMCKIIDSQKRIVHVKSGSFYRAISSEAYTKHGFNASAVIYDEVHTAPDRDLWDVLTTSMGAREQPLTFAITTAGYDRHSLAYELFDYSVKIEQKIIEDPTFLPILYYAPDKANWKDEEVWKDANPALTDFRGIDEMRTMCREAQEITSRENTFRRLYLNQWTEQDVRWLNIDKWDACDGQVNEAELYGRECYAGLDLASTTDIAALCLMFPEDGGYLVLPYFWIPAMNAETRQRRDRVPYLDWARDEWIEMTDGDVCDYDVIRRRIGELNKQFNIREIAIDRWNSSQLQTQLAGDGFEVIQFGQGFASMTSPTKELEKLVLAKKLAHGGNPVLRWMASNVTVEQDAAGNLKPSKKKSTEKIDGIVSMIMGLGRALVQENGPSVYDQRGLLAVGGEE